MAISITYDPEKGLIQSDSSKGGFVIGSLLQSQGTVVADNKSVERSVIGNTASINGSREVLATFSLDPCSMAWMEAKVLYHNVTTQSRGCLSVMAFTHCDDTGLMSVSQTKILYEQVQGIESVLFEIDPADNHKINLMCIPEIGSTHAIRWAGKVTYQIMSLQAL